MIGIQADGGEGVWGGRSDSAEIILRFVFGKGVVPFIPDPLGVLFARAWIDRSATRSSRLAYLCRG